MRAVIEKGIGVKRDVSQYVNNLFDEEIDHSNLDKIMTVNPYDIDSSRTLYDRLLAMIVPAAIVLYDAMKVTADNNKLENALTENPITEEEIEKYDKLFE